MFRSIPSDSYQVSSENATLRTGWSFEPFWWPHKYLCNVAVEEALEGIGCSSPSSRWGNRSDRFAKVTWPAQVGAGTVIQVSKWSVFNLSNTFICVLQTVWIMRGEIAIPVIYLANLMYFQLQSALDFDAIKNYCLLSSCHVPGTVLCAIYALCLNRHNKPITRGPFSRWEVRTCSSSQVICGKKGVSTRVWLLGRVLCSL